MSKVKISFGCALVLLVAGVVCTWPAQVMAQTTEPPDTEVTEPLPEEAGGDDAQTPSTANPPGYIGELLKAGDLKQEQVDTMRADGWGWGEIRIATRLAQQMVTNSTTGLTFDDALAQVMIARAEGKGFGQIAAENNLKVGQLVGARKAGDTQKGSAAQKGSKTQATDTDGQEAQTPSTAHPPAYIGELLKNGDLKQEQVDQMRAAGWGWGAIRIATRLAQQMVANSITGLTFDDALAQVMAARAEGKGFGQIAADNNVKVGQLVGNKKAGVGSAAKDGNKASAAAAATTKKPGFFARVGRFFGFGRSADKPAKPATVEKPQESGKAVQMDKPERPTKPERATKAERPERMERPSRPEKPEKGPHKG